MSTRQDNVQIRVEMDTTQGIQKMGQLENAVAEAAAEVKGLKRNTDEWKAAAEKLDGAQKELANYRQELGLSGLTMQQLTKYQGELRRSMANTTYGTDKWHELKGKLEEVTTTVNKQKGVLTDFQKSWKSIKDDLVSNAVQAGIVGVLVGAGAAVASMVTKNAELSDSLSNVAKTTGMSMGEVKQLNSELSKVNTRTARGELLDIAAVAGQLAIPNEQILGFVQATDKLNVSLGDEIQGGAEEVTRVMGGLRNVLTDIKTEDVGTDMLHIGNALNVLAAQGSATAPVVADIANRIGGVGQVMGLTSGQTLGLAATMQELNITAERGGTAVVKILQHMAATPGKFAQVAGVSGAKFKEIVDTDIYGALKLVMAGASGGGKAATALASTLDALGVDGAGTSEVIAKMGLNIQMLEGKTKTATASLKDTKSILSEFDTLNNNFAAQLQRVGKWWNGLFTASSLQPMIGGIVELLDGMVSVKDGAQALTEEWERQKGVVESLEKDTAPLIDRYDELSSKANLNQSEQAELDKIIAKLAATVPEAVTQFDSYGRALGINSKIAREAIQDQKDLLKFMNSEKIAQGLEQIKTLRDKAKLLQKNLSYRDEEGHVLVQEQMTTYSSGVGNSTFSTRQATRQEITKWSTELKGLVAEIDSLENAVSQMGGPETARSHWAKMLARAEANHARLVEIMSKSKKAVEDTPLLNQIDEKIAELKAQQNAVKGKIGLNPSDSDFPKELATLQKQIDAWEKYRQQLLGKYKDKDAAKKKKDAEKEAERRRREHEQALEELRRFLDQVHKAEERVNEDHLTEDQREIQQIQQKYTELREKAEAFAYDTRLGTKEHDEAILALKRVNAAEEIEIADKKAEQLKKRLALEFKHRMAEAQAEAALRVLLAQDEVENTTSENGGDSAGQAHKDALLKLAAAETQGVLDMKQVELDELEELRKKDLLSADQVAKRKALIEEGSAKKIRDINKKTAKEIKAEWAKNFQEGMQVMQQLGNSAFDIASKYVDNEAKRDDQEHKKKQAKLDQQLKDKLLTEEQYNVEKGKLDEEYNRKQAQHQKEQAEIQKASAIFNTAINGAVAAVRAYADAGPFGGIAMSAIIAAITAAQIALIVAEPIPEYAEGGFTANGLSGLQHRNLSRSAGGMLPGGPFLATVNEQGSEYFVPADLLSDPQVQPHVAAIEAVRTGRAGAAATGPGFAQGGATGPLPQFTAPSATGQAPMSEQTGQAIYVQLVTLNDNLVTGRIKAEVVSEELARQTKLQTLIRADAAY